MFEPNVLTCFNLTKCTFLDAHSLGTSGDESCGFDLIAHEKLEKVKFTEGNMCKSNQNSDLLKKQ